MKSLGLFVTFVVLTSPAALALNLKEAATIAVSASTKVKAALAEKEQSANDITKSKSPFLPQLDLKANYQYFNESPSESNPEWLRSAGLALSQNIWNNNLDTIRLNIARKQLEIAELKLAKVKSEVLLEAIQLFINALETKNSSDLEKQFLLESNKIFKMISSQYYQGTRSRQDFLRFQSQNERAKLGALNAEYRSKESIETLKQYLKLAEIENLEEISIEKQPLLKTNIPSRIPYFESKNLSLNDQLLSFKNEVAKKDTIPKLEFKAEAGYSLEGSKYPAQSWQDQNQNYWNVGLFLNWNLLDWGYRSAALEQKVSENAIVKLNLSQELIDAQKLVNTEMTKLQSLQQQLELAERLFLIEKENQLFSARDFQDGKGTYISYSSSVADYSSSVTQKNQIKYSLISSKFKISHLLGLLNENSIQ